jgi:hypothetical protein
MRDQQATDLLSAFDFNQAAQEPIVPSLSSAAIAPASASRTLVLLGAYGWIFAVALVLMLGALWRTMWRR